MCKKVLKFRFRGTVETQVVQKSVDGVVQENRIPAKKDVARKLVEMWKLPDEDGDFYEFVNLLYDGLDMFYSPLESTEGNTMRIPGHTINVTTGQYYDTSRELMMRGEHVVYVVGDEKLIYCLQSVLNYQDVRDERDLEAISGLIEISPFEGLEGKEIQCTEASGKMLKMRLYGIIQKWSKEGWRDNVLKTEPLPTKKGIVELCGCALGIIPWSRQTREQELEQLNQQIKVYYSPDESRLGEIREDVFYEEDDVTGEEIECRQEMIVDADFVLYISAEPEILCKLDAAFVSPAYMLVLGDTDCIPSCRISEGIVCTDADQHLIEIQE